MILRRLIHSLGGSAALTVALLAALWLGGGCIIGTWPTPEAQSKRSTGGEQASGEEACDGRDNNADGLVDEGCACSPPEASRGCVAIASGGQCLLGVQTCLEDGWSTCDVERGAFVMQARQPDIILWTDSTAVVRDDPAPIRVYVQTVTRCAGILVDTVEISLAATEPLMRLSAVAVDDGIDPDVDAADGLFVVELPNVFGPGVPAQTLRLRATALIGGIENSASLDLPFEEAP